MIYSLVLTNTVSSTDLTLSIQYVNELFSFAFLTRFLVKRVQI